jgi:hypothetical protein
MMPLRIELRFGNVLDFNEARDFQSRIGDLDRLKELPPVSEKTETRRIWIYYCADGKVYSSYEVQELDLEGKILGKTRYFSPEDLK